MPAPLVEAPIAAVLAFRQGARITRRLVVPRGADRIRVAPLPLGLADGSLRVRATHARVIEAKVALATVEAPDDALRPAVDQALQDARLVEGRLEARIAAIRTCLEAMEAITLPPRARLRNEEPPPSPTAARLAVARLRRAVADARHARLRELDDELRRAREARADLEEKDRRATSERQTREHELRKAVDLMLEDVGDGAEIALEYDVSAARWFPTYTLRFDDAYGHAALDVRASVVQRTGEDWQGVDLVCSTASPGQRAELPELRSLRLGRAQAEPRRGFREPPVGAEALLADFDAAFARPVTRSGGPPTVGAAPKALRMPMPSAPSDALAEEAVAFAAPVAQAAPPPPPAARAPVAGPGGPPSSATFPQPESKKRAARGTGRLTAASASAIEPPGGTVTFGSAQAVAEGAPPPPSLELHVGDGLLDFGALRMAAPTEPGRTKLRPATAAERFGDPDAAARVRAATRVRLPPLPERAVAPSALDGFDHAYAAETTAHVPSDGAFHAVPLRLLESATERRYVVVPRESREVFRYVAFDDPLGEPLLPGPLDVYVGDRFLTTRRMPRTPQGERLELGLGVEQGIEVARNAIFEERTTGLMRGGLELVHEVRVAIENHLTSAAKVEVRERLPVPAEGEDEVEVRVEKVSPRWEPWEPEPVPPDPALRGGHRWRVALEPSGTAGSRVELELQYTVRIAGKHALVGGNRRES